MSLDLGKRGGVILALAALPLLLLIPPLAIALFAAFVSGLSMPLP